jgi:hypothetical protein
MTNPARNPTQASRLPGITLDDALLLQTAPTTFLLAVARGQVDLNAMVRHEMVSRGLGKDGVWVGEVAAERIWAAAD